MILLMWPYESARQKPAGWWATSAAMRRGSVAAAMRCGPYAKTSPASGVRHAPGCVELVHHAHQPMVSVYNQHQYTRLGMLEGRHGPQLIASVRRRLPREGNAIGQEPAHAAAGYETLQVISTHQDLHDTERPLHVGMRYTAKRGDAFIRLCFGVFHGEQMRREQPVWSGRGLLDDHEVDGRRCLCGLCVAIRLFHPGIVLAVL